MTEKLDRIDAIEIALRYQLPPHKQQALLHEALDLCEAMGFDDRWRVFKHRLEVLQQGEVHRLKTGEGQSARRKRKQQHEQ